LGEEPVQEPEIQPDPEPEYFDPSDCNALEIMDIEMSSINMTTSPSDETTCTYFTSLWLQIKEFASLLWR